MLASVIRNSFIFMFIEQISIHLSKYTISTFFTEKYNKIQDKNKLINKTAENITSILHTFVTVYYSFYILTDKLFWIDRLYHTSNLSTQLGCISCGYFLYDTIICIYRYNTSGFAFLVHGVSCLIVNSFSLYFKIGHFHWAASILWELSTPFVHIRSFLLKLNINRFKNINDTLLVSTFFFIRIICGFCFGYMFWYDVLTNNFIRESDAIIYYGLHLQLGLNIVMNSLNVYWFSLMLRKITVLFIENKTK